jgi:putative heme iron utilization protein
MSVSPDQISTARLLLRGTDRAALATLLASPQGPAPYASLALIAVDHDLSPILLISGLAVHTQAIQADARVSLLLDGTAGLDHALTGARLSVMGRAAISQEPRLRERYIARHPEAAMYADFKDFNFYRVAVERAHLVSGFGKIDWIDAADLMLPQALDEKLVEHEAGVVQHMNEDHADAVALYASTLLQLPGDGWRMTGCDRDGIDLRAGGQVARLAFPEPVADANGARQALITLVQQARAKAAAE